MQDQRDVLHGNAPFFLVDHVVSLPQPVEPSRLDRVIAGLGRLFCRIHGHDMLPQFNSNRMFLRCMSCGHETPGWQLAGAPPVVRFRGDAERHVVERVQMTIYGSGEGVRSHRVAS